MKYAQDFEGEERQQKLVVQLYKLEASHQDKMGKPAYEARFVDHPKACPDIKHGKIRFFPREGVCLAEFQGFSGESYCHQGLLEC